MSIIIGNQPETEPSLELPENELMKPAAPLSEALIEVPAKTSEPAPLSPNRTKKDRRVFRVGVALILISLAAVGYWQREQLQPLLSGQAAGQGSPGQAKAAASDKPKVLYWIDPMHPSYKSDQPGQAPDCGMDLVPVYEGGQTASSLPAGAFMISPAKQQLIGVQYGTVAYQTIFRTLRAVGRLALDETRISHVHAKYEGWIEEVHVDFTGKEVRKGQPLLTIYSPELLQTQQEYLLALRGQRELSESPFKEAAAGAESLYQSARRRLELWDISEAQIEQLERTGKPIKAMTLYAPSSGFVLTRNAFPRQRVTSDPDLYTIADLSTIWVIADIYEYEAAQVKLGQAAEVTLSYLPGRKFKGKVTYIYPQVDSATRTLKVRIEVANPGLVLKPEMYAEVELRIDYGRQLVIPQEAVLDSGSAQTVFVSHQGGYFEPRRVQLGAHVDDQVIVLGGLKAGEQVVTSANFLIDSESKLKSAMGGFSMPGMDHGARPPAPQVDHSQHKVGAPTPAQVKPEDHSPDHSSHTSAAPPNTTDRLGHQAKPADHSDHQMPTTTDPQAGHKMGPPSPARSERKVLYWYDPMHPNHKSDKPGKAPDCGMDLVPKYADEKKAN